MLLGRPCGSNSRHKDRWTREEIEELARRLGIHNIHKKTIDELCRQVYPISTISVKVQGCKSITQYDYSTEKSTGHIALIGENHTYPGNNPALLEEILKKTRCPIDICVERDYEIGRVPQKLENSSLMSYFRTDPIRLCSTKGYVPKQDNILSSSPKFWRDCIEPYRGRVKIWSLDLREYKFFRVLLIPARNAIAHRQKQVLFEAILSYDRYKVNPDSYKLVVESEYRIYLHIQFPTEDDTRYSTYLDTGKNHMRLMHDLGYLPKGVIKQWIRIVKKHLIRDEMIRDKFDTMRGIMDIYTALRIVRLIQQEENRIILFFGGDTHRRIIDELLTVYTTHVGIQPIYNPKTVVCGKDDHKREMILPNIPCNKSTKRMTAYRSRIQKK